MPPLDSMRFGMDVRQRYTAMRRHYSTPSANSFRSELNQGVSPISVDDGTHIVPRSGDRFSFTCITGRNDDRSLDMGRFV